MRYSIIILSGLLLTHGLAAAAHAQDSASSIITDSRIKTLVYNENEVYNLVTHYGYQSNIEFAKNEEIETISIGDKTGWQIIPAGRRLFIKALAVDLHTNMTIITDKRTYQFDLMAREAPERADQELVYVVRFFYPEEGWDAPKPIVESQQITLPPPLPPVDAPRYNFNYSLAGDNTTAPIKVFDDGMATYLQFPPQGGIAPQVSVVRPDGNEMPVAVRVQGEYLLIDTVAPQLTIRRGGDLTCIFNETLFDVGALHGR